MRLRFWFSRAVDRDLRQLQVFTGLRARLAAALSAHRPGRLAGARSAGRAGALSGRLAALSASLVTTLPGVLRAGCGAKFDQCDKRRAAQRMRELASDSDST
jgi:hypothetical protein